MPWHRFETVLAAKIIEADPAGAEQRAKLWQAEWFVRTGRTGEGGLKLLGGPRRGRRRDLVCGCGEPDR